MASQTCRRCFGYDGLWDPRTAKKPDVVVEGLMPLTEAVRTTATPTRGRCSTQTRSHTHSFQSSSRRRAVESGVCCNAADAKLLPSVQANGSAQATISESS